MDSSTEQESEESGERVCCPDDLCIGALDHEGRCGECARVFAQYARAQHVHEGSEREDSEREDSEREFVSETPGDPAAYREAPAMEELERECCDDDLCTGALGPDGVCGTCGRSSIKVKSASEGGGPAADERSASVASEGEGGQ